MIRDFRATDQHPVKNLILHGLREHWGSLNTELNQDLDDLLESHRKGRVLVVVVGSIVVGTGMVLPCGEGDAEIVRMSIVRKLPRSSLGGSLVERLTATAGSWGAARIIRETSSDWSEVIDTSDVGSSSPMKLTVYSAPPAGAQDAVRTKTGRVVLERAGSKR